MRDDLLWLTAYAGCVTSIIVLLITGGGVPLQQSATWVTKGMQSASLFFGTSITAAQIQNDYKGVSTTNNKVRILIVPGHQPTMGGTEFGGVLERDVVVDIASALATLLSQNPHYDVMVARTKTAWNPTLQTYFDTHALDIETFRQSLKKQMATYVADGSILPAADQVYHNSTSDAASLQLYGINKWSSDNGYDITLHLHINDDDQHRSSRAGQYSGFAVYVPDRQYANAAASRSVAEAIAGRLNAYHATSTLAKEDVGVVEDQKLIAVGSNNSASNAALLIEYGYIYESQFQESSVLPSAVRDYAYATYLGLQDFFQDPVLTTYGTLALPYNWTLVSGKKNEKGPGVYALQAALHHLGYYPPIGKSFSDCPVSGVVGSCTRTALVSYQKAHTLEMTGLIGPMTGATLTQDLAR